MTKAMDNTHKSEQSCNKVEDKKLSPIENAKSKILKVQDSLSQANLDDKSIGKSTNESNDQLLLSPKNEQKSNNFNQQSTEITSVYHDSMQNLDNTLQNNYHLSYLTPEEIFLKFIVPANFEEASHFFTQLCQAHHLIEDDIFIAKSLFSFVLESHKLLVMKSPKTHTEFNLESFLLNLKFSNSINLFIIFTTTLLQQNNSHSDNTYLLSDDIISLGKNYFANFLGIVDASNHTSDSLDNDIDIEDVEDNEDENEPTNETKLELILSLNHKDLTIHDIINMHNDIVDKIASVFTLNERVKQILLNHNKTITSTEDKTYLIIKNAVFNGEIPSNKEAVIQSRLLRSKQILAYAVEEQTMFHNIVQGLITKNESQFLHGIDSYILHYLDSEERKTTIHELSVNDMIVLFCSNYFITIQNPNSVLIDFMFNHYDHKIFAAFIGRYNVPKNLLIRVTSLETAESSAKEFFIPFIEFALLNNNYTVADNLIKLGFKLEPFNQKIIDDNQVFHYQYRPFEELSLLTESQFLYLIKNNLVTAEQYLNYQEFADDKSSSVSNNIFFYFAYRQFNDAFISLYEKTKKENLKFVTKSLRNYYNTDLLSYYLMFCNKNEAYGFDVKILDILISEGYVPEDNPSGPDLIHVLKEYDPETLVDAVQYLKNIFPTKYSEELSVKPIKPIKTETALIQWFDKTKLEEHFKKIEKEKDNVNKEYIKHMLLNNVHLKPNLLVNNEGFFDDLQTQFPNFEEVIRFYKSQFRLKKLSGKTRITPILLLGEPGIGKTYFAKKLAESLDTGYTFLDMASVTAGWVITGNNGTWKSSKQGKVLEAIMNSRTINPIFLMDELEKARSGEFDPTMSLYQLLEEINAKAFTDEFIDFQFDASGIIYIACANTLGNLSEPLKTRFKIINVPKPNNEQIISIINNIYNEATKDTHIFSDVLNDDIISILKKETLRSIKVMIDEAVGVALLDMDSKEIQRLVETGDKVSLQLKDFKSPFKKKTIGFSQNQ